MDKEANGSKIQVTTPEAQETGPVDDSATEPAEEARQDKKGVQSLSLSESEHGARR